MLKGRQHRITIGTYPIIGLKDARERARKLLETVSYNKDPRIELRAANLQRYENTVEGLLKPFLEAQKRSTKLDSYKKLEGCFRLHILPTLGRRPVIDIRKNDVHDLIEDLIAKNREGTAREVRKNLSIFFNWMDNRGDILAQNPMIGLKRKDLMPKEAGRSLTDDDLAQIWKAADKIGYPWAPYYKLLILTGQRRNEWSEAKRSAIDVDNKILKIEQNKSDRLHIVPLSDAALEIIEMLPDFGPDSYLFSSCEGAKPISGFNNAHKKLVKAFEKEIPPFRPHHDFRVTCKTRLADPLEIAEEVRDAILNHARSGLEKAYNRADYMKQKRTALQLFSDHIMEIVNQ